MTRDDYRLFGARAMARRGTDLPHARLNDGIVRNIRASVGTVTAREWAERLNVHKRTIDKIREFRSWVHVRIEPAHRKTV